LIDNPEYKAVDDLYSFPSFESAGIEVWQVKAGTIFDNFLVTDDEELAAAARKKVNAQREAEQKLEAEERAAEAEKEKEEAPASEEKEDL